MKDKLARWIAVIAITLALILPQGLAADIDGTAITPGTPSTRTFVFTQTTTALGGANKSINATTETQTLAWQAFYGNVSGNITLETTTGAMFYGWNDAHNGTVLASRNNSIDFTTLTAQNNCSADQTLTGTGSDRTNLTFTPSSNKLFEIGGITIAANTACTTHTHVNSSKQTTKFEEIILQAGTSTIYATTIETNTTGFDGKQHDFQIIVPDYQNSTTSTYYIYVALQ